MAVNFGLARRATLITTAVLSVFIIAAVVFLLNNKKQSIPYSDLKIYNIIFGQGGNPLVEPSLVSLGLNGEVFVVDRGSKKVMVFAENGRYLYSFSGSGSGLAELKDPAAIDVGKDGSVYIADREKQAVVVFKSSGGYKYTISRGDRGDFIPGGIAAGEGNELYIFNEADRNMYVYNVKGKSFAKVSAGKSPGTYLFGDICIDPDSGLILAVDVENRGVVAMRDGKAVRSFGRDRLLSPVGISYDRSHRLIFVSDAEVSSIVVFGTDGKYIGEFGTEGDSKNSFNLPGGLAMDQRGRLFVADTGNKRIVIYSFK